MYLCSFQQTAVRQIWLPFQYSILYIGGGFTNTSPLPYLYLQFHIKYSAVPPSISGYIIKPISAVLPTKPVKYNVCSSTSHVE